MRITNKVLSDTFLRNLSTNLNQMYKYQQQLSSGKLVSRPSDDPLLVAKIMSMDNNIALNEQYNTNIRDSLGWVKTQDTALADATSTLQRIKDLIIYGSNGSLSELDRSAISEEVKQKLDQLADILNTSFDGRYIFAGQKTHSRPFKVEDGELVYNNYLNPDDPDAEINYDENSNNVFREISQGVEIKLITDGNKLMRAEDVENEDNKNLGDLLSNVIDALDKGDTEKLSGELLADIQKHIDNVVRVRTQIGAIYNRLEAAEERNIQENLHLKELLSQREDIDIAERFMEYTVMSNVYVASLNIGAKILQPSLLDYLR